MSKNTLFSSRLCRDYPSRPAIVGDGKSCTYAEMRRGINGLSKKLREMGVEKGSRVALWSYNSANWLVEIIAHCSLYCGYGELLDGSADNLFGNPGGQFDGILGVHGSGVCHYRQECALEFAEVGLYIACQVLQHILPDSYALAAAKRLEHLQAGCVIGMKQLHGQTPLEAGQQAVLEVLELHWSPVRREYQLLAVLVQVVEDIEEGVLGSGALEVLDIVHDEDVYLLVESQEIGELVADVHGIHVLGLELVSVYVKHYEVRELVMYGDADRLCKMGLAEAGAAENEKRIEGGLSGCRGDGSARSVAHLVAFTYYEVGEAIHRIELGVDLYLPDSWIDEGTGGCGRLDVYADTPPTFFREAAAYSAAFSQVMAPADA